MTEQNPPTPPAPPTPPDPAPGPELTPSADSGTGGKVYSKEELEAIVKDRVERERKAAERKAERERAQAQQQALEQRQEWETLANERKTTLDSLQPRAELADKYETALTTYVTKEREGLPASVVSLLETMDYADQLEWIANNKDEFLQASPPPPPEPQRRSRFGVDPQKVEELQNASDDPRVAIEHFNQGLRQRMPGG